MMDAGSRAGWVEWPSPEYQKANPDWNKAADSDNTTAEPSRKERPLEVATLTPVGAHNIPPRPWAYGNFLLFGSVAVIGAVDGGGKGLVAVGILLATITGQPLLGERVWRAGPVAIITYEDDETEWHRRIAAACIHYQLDYDAILPKVHFIFRPGGRVSFASTQDGYTTFPDGKGIIEKLTEVGAALLLVDPFNHAHNLDDGNSNVMIAKVAGEMSRIARDTRAAILVLHHLRKGSNGSPDDLMGATSLRATFRSCRILARMTPEVAEKMKILDPWRYIRIAGSKENYAPPPEKSSWYKLIGIELGNATDAYPNGDNVGVATTWTPRPLFEGMDVSLLTNVFETLRKMIHGPNRQAKHTPWAGTPLMNIGGRSEREAGKIIADWIESGVLVKGKYYHTPSRHEVERLVLDDLKVAEILREIADTHTPSEYGETCAQPAYDMRAHVSGPLG